MTNHELSKIDDPEIYFFFACTVHTHPALHKKFTDKTLYQSPPSPSLHLKKQLSNSTNSPVTVLRQSSRPIGSSQKPKQNSSITKSVPFELGKIRLAEEGSNNL